jgi:spore maturation protein CgeB
MKVLIIGSDKIYAIENHYLRHLQASGTEVFRFSAQGMFYDYYDGGLINKVLFKLGISSIYRKINKEVKRRINSEAPTVVWVFKGQEIFPSTLRWIRQKKIKLVNYNPDNPFIFSGSGSGNRNITESIVLYDLHFTYSHSIRKRLEETYRATTAILPFGFEVDEALYESCIQEGEIIKTCFLGNPDTERALFIKSLADQGIVISVYGHDWRNFLNHPNIEINGPVYGDEVWKILRKYRVQLNLMRVHNLDSHNMRTFEVPGIGGIMVAPDTPEHQSFFDAGKEAFFYKDIDDCARIIRHLTEISYEQALHIRRAARERSVFSGYSYQARAKYALETLRTVAP